jgi:hypothetical protein
LRDPSHVHALTLGEMEDLFRGAGLVNRRTTFYRLEVELGRILQHAFVSPADVAELRRLFEKEVEHDTTGFEARRAGDDIHLSYPVAVVAADRPGAAGGRP